MKIWQQFGSEHSANLVMIGHFKDLADASKAKGIIDAITQQATEDEKTGSLVVGSPSESFGSEMLKLLGSLNVGSVGPQELEQFIYDVDVQVAGTDMVLTTDEIEVSAFFKVMFGCGARIEVFSAHDYPKTGHGRA